MPGYALASAPIEMDVVHPLSLEVRVYGKLPMGSNAPLAPALQVILTNRSDRPRAFATPEDGASLRFEVEIEGSSRGRLGAQLCAAGSGTHAADELISPGASRALIGPHTHADELCDMYQPMPGERFTRIRAIYDQTFREGEVVRGRKVGHGQENNDRNGDHGKALHRNGRRVTAPWVAVPSP
jgi:hypothetical protein